MKKFNKILCIVEPNDQSAAAVVQALKISNDHQADVTFASVLGKVGPWQKLFKKEGETNIKLQDYAVDKQHELQDWLKAFDIDQSIEVKVYTGIGFIEIIIDTLKNGYDLVVKCADGMDWLDRLLGSDDMQLLRKCPCPVLMLKPSQKNVFRNIMVAVDVNTELNESTGERVQETLNSAVVNYGATLSTPELAQLHLCSVWDALGESYLRHNAFANSPEDQVDRYVEEVRLDCLQKLTNLVDDSIRSMGKDVADYLQPQIHFVKGNPTKEIPLMANAYNIDLIVMGTVARTGIPGFIIGNTAESILEQVTCSVLAIKPEGFKTPVVAI